MNEFAFEPATKGQAKARIALAGPSGAGKTWTGLILSTTLGRRVAVIDTERGSASKYAGEFSFDRLNMQRYDPRDLPKALAAAAEAGYDAVLIDSLSKFWGGQGGMLEQVDNAAKRGYGGNSFGGWKEARPMETAMIEAILSYPGHVVVTMRTKTAYEIIEDNRGRKVPTKIGLKPEQRDGIEYEFDIVGDMDLENTLTVSKSRCSALSGEVIRRPGADLAETILAWLSDGQPVLDATEYRQQALRKAATYADLKAMYLTVRDAGLLGAAVTDARGEAMSLGQLIISRGKEAEARETFGVEAAAPDAAGAGAANGHVVNGSPVPPDDEPPATGSRTWLAMATEAAAAFPTAEAGRKLWREAAAQHKDKTITTADRKHLEMLISARIEDLEKAPADAGAIEGVIVDEAPLEPDDPWAAKVEEITCPEDVDAAEYLLDSDEAITDETYRNRIRTAIKARAAQVAA